MADRVGFGNRVRVFSSDSSACGSIVEIEEGKRTEMGFHMSNDKVIYVLVGSIRLVVVTGGVIKSQQMLTGASVSIKAGTVHQLEGVSEKSIVVEFGTNMGAYIEDPTDFNILEKGTQAPVDPVMVDDAPEVPSVVMTEEDKAKVEVEEKTETKSTSKQTSKKRTKRKPRKKKTSK